MSITASKGIDTNVVDDRGLRQDYQIIVVNCEITVVISPSDSTSCHGISSHPKESSINCAQQMEEQVLARNHSTEPRLAFPESAGEIRFDYFTQVLCDPEPSGEICF